MSTQEIDRAVERKRLAARMRALAAWISGSGKGAHSDLKCGPTADDLLTVAGILDDELEARVPQQEEQ